MARIFQEGDWYEQLSADAFYEEEYERILVANAGHFFPSYHLVPFKKTVDSERGSARADLALIHKRYWNWWVVETELSHHSLSGHVRPQVEKLGCADYSEGVAEYLCRKASHLDSRKMLSVTKGQQPKVLVVVNAPVPNWAIQLRPYGALVVTLEIFRSRQNRHVYRMEGELPPDGEVARSVCVLDVARLLRVMSPGILPIENGEILRVAFRGALTEWGRVDIADRVYLSSARPVSLNYKARYELVHQGDDSYVLEEYA